MFPKSFEKSPKVQTRNTTSLTIYEIFIIYFFIEFEIWCSHLNRTSRYFFKGWWHLVAFIDHTHFYQLSYMQLYNTQHACQAVDVWIEYTISLIQIRCYAAVFYGVLLRISPATFLQLKI